MTTEQPRSNHDSGTAIDFDASQVEPETFKKLLKAQTDRFMQEETGRALVEMVTRALHYFSNSGEGELQVTVTYEPVKEGRPDVYVIGAIYRHQTPTGILLCSGRVEQKAETVAESQMEVSTWRAMVRNIATGLRAQLQVDLKKAGVREIQQGGRGWYEAGRGYTGGRAALPPMPERIDPDAEAHAIEVAKESLAALAGIEKEKAGEMVDDLVEKVGDEE